MKVNRIDGRNDGGIFLVARVSTEACSVGSHGMLLDGSRDKAFLDNSGAVVTDAFAVAGSVAALAGNITGCAVGSDESFAQRRIVAGARQQSRGDWRYHGLL